jgi:hypothetical protein
MLLGRVPWRWWMLVVALAVGWAVLRLAMNREFRDAPWSALLALEARLPFGHRVLVPLLARPLVDRGLDVRIAWGGFETLATVALVLLLARVFEGRMHERAARLLAACVLGVLSFAYLLPHRWSIFYPWDTPAMAFVVAGVVLVLERRFAAACAITAIAALNRESAVLVPACTVVLWLHDEGIRRRALPWAGLMGVVYASVRWGVAIGLPDNRGASLHTALDGRYRLFNNLEWLADPAHAVTFVGSLGFVPLLWLAVHRHVPSDLQRLQVPALAALLGLMVVANVYEPRAFGEVIVLGWIAVGTALGRWLHEEIPPPSPRPSWLALFDRLAAPAVLILGAAFTVALHRWSFLPLMP